MAEYASLFCLRLGELENTRYIKIMNKGHVKTILDRVLTWPIERQEDAAKVLTLMEAQDDSSYRLTDEQVEEVHRRRLDKNAKRLTLDEFNERLRHFTDKKIRLWHK
jgi:hypothetical protein